FSMAECNAQSLQIGLSHIGQDIEIDSVLGKDGRVLPEPNLIKPGFYPIIDAHCRVLSPPTKSIVTFPFKLLHTFALRAPRPVTPPHRQGRGPSHHFRLGP